MPFAIIADGWNARPVPTVSQAIGDAWIRGKVSPLLRVPSVIVPKGDNYLLNNTHPAFERFRIGDPVPLAFDARLRKS